MEPKRTLEEAIREMGGVVFDAETLQRHIDTGEPLPLPPGHVGAQPENPLESEYRRKSHAEKSDES